MDQFQPNKVVSVEVSSQGNPDDIDFSAGWLGRVNPHDIPDEYREEARETATLRDVGAEAVQSVQRFIDKERD